MPPPLPPPLCYGFEAGIALQTWESIATSVAASDAAGRRAVAPSAAAAAAAGASTAAAAAVTSAGDGSGPYRLSLGAGPTPSHFVAQIDGYFTISGVLKVYVDADYSSYPPYLDQHFTVRVRFVGLDDERWRKSSSTTTFPTTKASRRCSRRWSIPAR